MSLADSGAAVGQDRDDADAQDPAGPSAMDGSSTRANGSEQLLDGGSTGTDDGPAGIPAALVRPDEDGCRRHGHRAA